jgi:DNA-binding GntR family transcriptional regulator
VFTPVRPIPVPYVWVDAAVEWQGQPRGTDMTKTTSKHDSARSTRGASRVAPGTGVDTAYGLLREAIIEGDLEPGAALRHHELSDRLGVSLIPIREAMRRLEVERLVETIPNKGARVARISSIDLVDVYATRVLLEQQALHLAWPNLTPDVVDELRELNRQLVEDVERANPRFYEIHRALHFAIYERAESPWLLHIIEILWSHTERYRRLAAQVMPFVDIGDDIHHKVLAAIADGDEGLAAEWLRRDLQRTADLITSVYADDDMAAPGPPQDANAV